MDMGRLMSRHFFTRLVQGYKGVKGEKTQRYYESHNITCEVEYCNNYKTKYKGVGAQLCEEHQSLLSDYGGPGRHDRPWTFNKKRTCESCGHDPWKHRMVKQIEDELVRDRVAWGMLIVDHVETQRDGGSNHPDNCQTLCLDCNQIKTTLACDSMPKKLYKSEDDYYALVERLRPHYEKLFG